MPFHCSRLWFPGRWATRVPNFARDVPRPPVPSTEKPLLPLHPIPSFLPCPRQERGLAARTVAELRFDARLDFLGWLATPRPNDRALRGHRTDFSGRIGPSAAADDPGEAARGLPVVGIEVVGNRRVSRQDILAYLHEKAGQPYAPESWLRMYANCGARDSSATSRSTWIRPPSG